MNLIEKTINEQLKDMREHGWNYMRQQAILADMLDEVERELLADNIGNEVSVISLRLKAVFTKMRGKK